MDTQKIQLVCNACGEKLEYVVYEKTENLLTLYVDPCSICEGANFEEGYQDGLDDCDQGLD